VKICASPEGKDETFVLCRSEGRKDKETAILNRFVARLQTGLNKLKEQAEQGRLRDRQKADRRIGRLLERNSRAASLFDVIVTEIGAGKDRRLAVDIKKDEERYQWALQSGGSYILRTNWKEADPKRIWRTLQQWMKASGLGTAPRKLIEEMREVRSLDVLLPAKDKTIRLRVVSTPSKELKVLLQRMKIFLPNRSKII